MRFVYSFLILILAALLTTQRAQVTVSSVVTVSSGVTISSTAAGGGGQSFSDDFNRGDSGTISDGTHPWTETEGDYSINGNTLRFEGGSFAHHMAIWDTACDGVDQYMKASFPVKLYQQFAFRITDSTSPFYTIQIQTAVSENDSVYWLRHPNDSSDGDIVAGPVTGVLLSDGDSIGITLTGTGTSTVFRIWKNPTGAIPDSATSWGGDTTPDWTLTNDPASPVDTGNKVGIAGQPSAATTGKTDDWSAGDIP